MVDLSQIEGFEWDEGNSRKSVEKYDVSQAEAEQVFFNEPLLVAEDVRHNSRETRLHALGHTDAGRLLHISFTLRGDGKLRGPWGIDEIEQRCQCYDGRNGGCESECRADARAPCGA